MNTLKRYEDLKFAIRCVDVWKELKPSDAELDEALRQEADEKGLDQNALFCQPLQDYMEMLIALIHDESGEWFFMWILLVFYMILLQLANFRYTKLNRVTASVLKNNVINTFYNTIN